jgi:fructose-1,6-bisphosphatase I
MVSEEDDDAILVLPEPPSPRLGATPQASSASSSSAASSSSSSSSSSAFGKYIVAFDPLDGSSNIDSSLPTGTLFGIWRRSPDRQNTAPTADEALRPGKDLVVAGYTLYSSATLIALAFAEDVATGAGVNLFTLDPSIGEFLLSHARVRIPASPAKVYSCNEAHSDSFPAYTRAFLSEVRKGGYSARYVGAMVADVHRTLLQGGVFFYPPTSSAPKGKLRLLYECAPMAMLLEAAGGKAISGIIGKEVGEAGKAEEGSGAGGGSGSGSPGRILDVVPTAIHERSPIILGCARDVDRLIALMKELKA